MTSNLVGATGQGLARHHGETADVFKGQDAGLGWLDRAVAFFGVFAKRVVNDVGE